MDWMYFILGGASGFFLGGFLKRLDMIRELERSRHELAQTRALVEKDKNQARQLTIIHFRDRVRGLLETVPRDRDALWRAVEVADSLPREIQDEVFPWLRPLKSLLRNAPRETPITAQSFSMSEFRDIELHVGRLTEACGANDARDLQEWFTLRADETPRDGSHRMMSVAPEKIAHFLLRATDPPE